MTRTVDRRRIWDELDRSAPSGGQCRSLIDQLGTPIAETGECFDPMRIRHELHHQPSSQLISLALRKLCRLSEFARE